MPRALNRKPPLAQTPVIHPISRKELLVRSAGVMRGYLDNPEATAATLHAGGWLHTGDIVTFDSDGPQAGRDRRADRRRVTVPARPRPARRGPAAEQSERVLAHASDLVVTLLSDRLDDSTRVRGAVQRSLMLRIKDYIGQRFRDPALGPAEIAAAVSISTRYLHKLFEADRQTVSLYIKGLCLDRARQDLPDSRQAGRPISNGFGKAVRT
jgi:protein-tyrosine-phosphatase